MGWASQASRLLFMALWFCHPVAVDLRPLQNLPEPEKLFSVMKLMAPTLIQNLRRVGSGARRLFLHSFTYSLNNYVAGAITCQASVLSTGDSEYLLGAYQWMGKADVK